MALDPTRASLVSQEYRYAIKADSSIKSIYPDAQEIIIDTNLNSGGATTMLNDVFAATSVYARAFTFDIEGLFFPEDFIGGMPRYTVAFDRYPSAGSNIYTMISAKPDYFAGITTITVRG